MHDPNSPGGRSELGTRAGRIPCSPTRASRDSACGPATRPAASRSTNRPTRASSRPRRASSTKPRFAFNASLAATDEERANPWRLLSRTFDDGAIAAIADQTTLMYSLHIGVGDDFVLAPDSPSPTRLRIVASLADSMLQSELIIGEDAFVRLFPRNEGYRVWLIDAPASDAAAGDGASRGSALGLRPGRGRRVASLGVVPPRREHLPGDVPGAWRAGLAAGHHRARRGARAQRARAASARLALLRAVGLLAVAHPRDGAVGEPRAGGRRAC